VARGLLQLAETFAAKPYARQLLGNGVRMAEFDPDRLERLMVAAFELLGRSEGQARELTRAILQQPQSVAAFSCEVGSAAVAASSLASAARSGSKRGAWGKRSPSMTPRIAAVSRRARRQEEELPARPSAVQLAPPPVIRLSLVV
jgi:hypothetical protein